ncbi:3D domain-containing protein [Muriicola sp.]|uniref:3D domain-containing protein n=1 Tax=Muriicola sp. TaxID=2020856 RepID=UPI003C766A86
MTRSELIFVLLALTCFIVGCKPQEESYIWQPLRVTATAYNSLAPQTNGNPNVAAWGDTLTPGMKCIAVSNDLYKKGLKHNTPVKIEGFEGIYLVKDKMHSKWENRIDIYMGVDVQLAKTWGRKKVTIQFGIPLPPTTDTISK